MFLSERMRKALTEELGFKAPITKPNASTERELKTAIKAYVIDNDKEPIVARIEGILQLLKDKRYERMLSVKKHGFAWRFLDTVDKSAMETILGTKLRASKTPVKLGAGKLPPDHRGLSSWTVNPRSLIFSGYFSVIPENSHLVLVKAPVRGDNVFFCNPDELVSALKLRRSDANGYALEREVIGVGPVEYEDAVYVLRDKSRSLEGQAMDLVNALAPVKTIRWTDHYYFPKLNLKK